MSCNKLTVSLNFISVLSQTFTFDYVHAYTRLLLNGRSFRATTISAVKAATKRSMQLGGVSSEDIEHKYNL